jgi:hypothetical protein
MSAVTWTVKGETLMSMLKRVHNGEDPEMVYMEGYANLFTEDKDES